MHFLSDFTRNYTLYGHLTIVPFFSLLCQTALDGINNDYTKIVHIFNIGGKREKNTNNNN